ncbi:MAG: family ATPase [Campylobacterota bacterium]|nr:family ATPase [Campylobacterota bacterium]
MASTNTSITTQNQAYEAIAAQLENIIKTDMKWDNEVSLSGAAGTGKTYLTTKLVKKLKEKYHITITAPTHKALQVLRQNLINDEIENVDTKTIQSFLNLTLVTDYDRGIQKFEPIKSKEKDNAKTDILIVDESSMIGQDLYEFIIKAIENERVKAVLYVGDEYQLLPIDSDKNQIFNVRSRYKLNEIVRQAKDSYIITMATKARNIIKSKNYISIKEFFDDAAFKDKVQFFNSAQSFYDDFCTPETWAKKDKAIVSFTNKSVDNHNRAIRKRFWEEQNVYDPETLLKGDKVIFQKANVISGMLIHQNSSIVELSSATKEYLNSLQIDFWDCKDLEDRPLKVVDPYSQGRFEMVLNTLAKDAKNEKHYETRKQKWERFFALKDMFADVKYIYASTIHKVQGSTYETVYIDLTEIENMRDKDMMYRLLYVALTRASQDVKILLPNQDNLILAKLQDERLNYLEEEFKNLNFIF